MNRGLQKDEEQRTRVEQVLPLLGFDVLHWNALGSGARNDAFRLTTAGGRDLVLRISRNAPQHFEREAAALTSLAHIESVPRLIVTGGDFIVTSFVEGKPITNLNDADIPLFAALVCEIHAVRFTSWGALPPRNTQPFSIRNYVETELGEQIASRETRGASAEIHALLEKLRGSTLRDWPMHFSLLHGDLKPSNLLRRSDGTLTLIDWEMAQAGPPARDLAELFTTAMFSESQRESFLCAYGNIDEIPREQIEVFTSLVRLAELLDD